jgi:hypothetical protein
MEWLMPGRVLLIAGVVAFSLVAGGLLVWVMSVADMR